MYILKSTLALSILLVFYRSFLEKEKMHHFNRAYLLGAILLSLAVPFLPTGLAFESVVNQPIVDSAAFSTISFSEVAANPIAESIISPIFIIGALYLIVLLFFCLKFGRNLFHMTRNVSGHDAKYYKGARIVLLDDDISPYTFWNCIFLNRKDFESNKIDQQLLDHELTHARQRHSWDILFIEIVILIFWFNPILRWYKTAIQLNHEFLADASVIEKYKTVKSYQYLLLDTIENNNKISLASNINFHLTQKRLKMMTKKSSSLRKKVLIFSILPVVLALLICCGNPVEMQNVEPYNYEVEQGDPQKAKDKYFADAIVHYTTKDGKIKVISYKSLSKDIKSKIPPPPPPPPALPGSNEKESKIEPLKKGTIVYLSKNGSIQIGNKKRIIDLAPPPPPPVKPDGVDGGIDIVAPTPPNPPEPPSIPELVADFTAPPPPPPPPPFTIDDLAEEGATFYINGKEVTKSEAKKLWNGDGDDVKCIDLKDVDGKFSVFMTKKGGSKQ